MLVSSQENKHEGFSVGGYNATQPVHPEGSFGNVKCFKTAFCAAWKYIRKQLELHFFSLHVPSAKLLFLLNKGWSGFKLDKN